MGDTRIANRPLWRGMEAWRDGNLFSPHAEPQRNADGAVARTIQGCGKDARAPVVSPRRHLSAPEAAARGFCPDCALPVSRPRPRPMQGSRVQGLQNRGPTWDPESLNSGHSRKRPGRSQAITCASHRSQYGGADFGPLAGRSPPRCVVGVGPIARSLPPQGGLLYVSGV